MQRKEEARPSTCHVDPDKKKGLVEGRHFWVFSKRKFRENECQLKDDLVLQHEDDVKLVGRRTRSDFFFLACILHNFFFSTFRLGKKSTSLTSPPFCRSGCVRHGRRTKEDQQKFKSGNMVYLDEFVFFFPLGPRPSSTCVSTSASPKKEKVCQRRAFFSKTKSRKKKLCKMHANEKTTFRSFVLRRALGRRRTKSAHFSELTPTCINFIFDFFENPKVRLQRARPFFSEVGL